MFYWCRELIKFFDIDKIEFPLPVGFIGRKRSVDFSDTTLETWKKIIPAQAYRIREQDKEIIIEEKVKVLFGGLDNQETINKFNSAELAFCGIDQAEETDRADLNVLEASLRLKHNEKTPPYKKLYTANPAECWLKDVFITNPRPGHYFVPALPTDNPHLPDGYIKTLEESFADDQSLLRAYRDGDWDVLSGENVLITSGMLEALKEINFDTLRVDFKHIISCDPATGGDECVIYYILNGKIKDQKYLHTNNDMVVVGEIQELAFKYNCNDIAVDCIGIGSGIASRLDEQHRNVLYLNSSYSGKRISEPERFRNLRAQMWWYTADQIRQKLIPYPADPELRKQLCSAKYKVIDSNGKVQVASTDEIKKITLCSPDRACAFVYGIWGLSQIDPVKITFPDREMEMKLAIRKKLKQRHEEVQLVGMEG